MPEPASSHLCVCHGEPAYWHKRQDLKSGGLWRCAVRKREVQRAASIERNAQRRDRYDADPIYRIGKNLHDNARRRGDTLKRQREALHGPVPQ